MHNLINKIR